MASSWDSAVVWSEQNYSMRETVESLRHSFPLICRTTSGYSGCDEDMLQIGSGETFWVFDVHRQQRLVVQAVKTDYYLSIPIEYPTKVQLVQDRPNSKKVGNPIPIREIPDLMSDGSSPVRLIFENNCTVPFQIGADMGSTARFDVLTAQQVYDEKYLLAYSICNGKIFTSVQTIPVFLPIEFSVATRLINRDAETWSSWTANIAQLTKSFKRTALRTTQEIILFNERPSNGEYEYIKLSDFSNFKEKDSIFSSEIVKRDRENQYEDIPSTNINQNAPKTNRNHSVPLPRLPPPLPRNADGTVVPVSPTHPVTMTTRRAPPPVPSRPDDDPPPKSPESGLPDPVEGPTEAYESLDRSSPSSSSSSLHLYASLSEVPVDIDFGRLTVEEVADCLAMLKMGQHADDFRSRQIDGRMVLSLTEEILVEEFHFRSFDAKQFLSFAKDRWRPKTSKH